MVERPARDPADLALGVYDSEYYVEVLLDEHFRSLPAIIDFSNGRFYFGPIEIWPHEFYYVAGLLIMAGVGLFLVTSAVGRAWCGYACPQTVWTDLFMWVERLVEGDRNARMRLDAAPWSFDKLWRKGGKHALRIVREVVDEGGTITNRIVGTALEDHADAYAAECSM